MINPEKTPDGEQPLLTESTLANPLVAPDAEAKPTKTAKPKPVATPAQLPTEHCAMKDREIVPGSKQPLLTESTLGNPLVTPDAEAKPTKTAKPKPVATPIPLPDGEVNEAVGDDDEFSPENLRLLNTLDVQDLVRPELLELPVRKPANDEWFKIHPDFQQQGGIIEMKSTKRIFWVSSSLQNQLSHDPCFSYRICVLAVTIHGVPFIWPLRPDPTEDNNYSRHARIAWEAVIKAKTNWTRMYWSGEKKFHIVETSDLSVSPKFPEKPFHELLKLAFNKSMVNTMDHPIILELKGKRN